MNTLFQPNCPKTALNCKNRRDVIFGIREGCTQAICDFQDTGGVYPEKAAKYQLIIKRMQAYRILERAPKPKRAMEMRCNITQIQGWQKPEKTEKDVSGNSADYCNLSSSWNHAETRGR